MRVGSLFSGIGAGDLGLERAGLEIAWQAEIDKHCNKVLERHWPEVPNLGDVRTVELQQLRGGLVGRESTASPGAGGRDTPECRVDLIIGGFPCQDVSVAGKRAGLDGERSGLWFEFQRILSELRPRWVIVENVPGLLSSNQGRDFATILDGLGECGFGGIAWAVLDSQHFGVAQRRRRVFIVGGPSRRSVEQVLSLCESCGGNPAPGREARQDVAASLSRGSSAASNEPGRRREDDVNLVHTLRAEGFDASEDGTGRGTPLTWGISSDALDRSGEGAAGNAAERAGLGILVEQSPALRSRHPSAIAGATVRRLTPVEAERLQGLPDGWTCTCGAGPELARCKCADGPRYRGLGNAMTMPVIEYLGLRIMAVRP